MLKDDIQTYVTSQLASARACLKPVIPQTGGFVTEVNGLTLVAKGLDAKVNQRCLILNDVNQPVPGEVIGFNEEEIQIMPLAKSTGFSRYNRVVLENRASSIEVSFDLAGRVIDSSGMPLDSSQRIKSNHYYPLYGQPINAFDRRPIRDSLDVGIRAINALLTVGKGQRIGLFAGSGVGKSVLLGQMTKYTSADIVVVGLIGERGREVKEFIEDVLGDEGRKRSVVIASPADDLPLQRINAAWRATAIAEYFRDNGMDVLLLVDSLTRFAQAHREVGLGIGLMPVSKGYPSTVFSNLASLVERAGNGVNRQQGSITAIYTVLAEGDDQQDPIADASRAILDGHIVLSRDIAEEGIYPAISIDKSISRVMNNVIDADHRRKAVSFKRIYSAYEKNKDLIHIGAYRSGSDPLIDYAIQKQPEILGLLSQNMNEGCSLEVSISQLKHLLRDFSHEI
jgi:flagellum-specific ATP synthase